MFEFSDGTTAGNAQVFATHDEALESAAARFAVWTMPVAFFVDPVDAPVNYRRVNGGDVNIAASALYERAGAVLGKAKL